MNAFQKLCKNGSSTMVTIPAAVLRYLGWQTGDTIVLELLEDQSVRIRRPVARDFAPPRVRPFVQPTPAAETR